MKSKVFIRIKDKENGYESEEVTIEELIYKQDDIVFVFTKEDTVLPYKDFLLYRDDYDVIVRIAK